MNASARFRPLFPAFLAVVVSLVACEDETIIRVPPPEIHTDQLAQQPAALVDILWVVDNSGTMQEEQEALATNFDRFITGLTVCQGSGMAGDICNFANKTCTISGAPCNPPDYHIGVISTDVSATAPEDQGRLRRVGLCTTAAGSTPSNDKFRYCRVPADCAPNANDPASDPANSLCDLGQAITFVSPSTPGATSAFEKAVRVGIQGTAGEKGIEAAARALGRHVDRAAQTGQFLPMPTENDGFLRSEASLFVIFVSDEDDNSFGQAPYFYRVFESLKRAGNESLISFSSIVGDPDLDGDGPNPGGCAQTVNNPQMIRTAFAGTRYVALSMYSRGLTAEFRVCDGERLTCGQSETCSFPVPELPGICIPSSCQIDQDCGNFKCGDRGCVSCDNAQCATDADRFVQLLERNGIFGSICSDDYGVVLDALGFEAAGLRRKFELTKFPDCQKGNSDPVPCFAGDPPADGTEPPGAIMCVKVNGEVLPNDRDAGWVYEPGSNAIFFDGNYVPPTDAKIEVSYRAAPETAEGPLSCAELLN